VRSFILPVDPGDICPPHTLNSRCRNIASTQFFYLSI
jgi:hypothetical protein